MSVQDVRYQGVCVCVRVCVRACVCVYIYINNILQKYQALVICRCVYSGKSWFIYWWIHCSYSENFIQQAGLHSMVVCWTAPGAWFTTKVISLAQVVPSPVYPNCAEWWPETPFHFLYSTKASSYGSCFVLISSNSAVTLSGVGESLTKWEKEAVWFS